MSDGRAAGYRTPAPPIEARRPPRPGAALLARVRDRVLAGAGSHAALAEAMPGTDPALLRRAVSQLVSDGLLCQDGRQIAVPVPVLHPEEEREMPRHPERTTAPRAANGGAGCRDAPRAAQVARYVRDHPGASRVEVAVALGLGASNASKALTAAIARGWVQRSGSGIATRFLPGAPPPGEAAQPASGEVGGQVLARASASEPGPTGGRQPEPGGASPPPAPQPPVRPSPAPEPPIAPAPVGTSVEVSENEPEAGGSGWVPPTPSAVTDVLARLREREEELERELDDVQTAQRVLMWLQMRGDLEAPRPAPIASGLRRGGL